MLGHEACGLRPLAGAWGPQKYQPHLTYFPSQLRLLDQAFILVRDQVALNLRNRIERDTDHDQKRCATKVEWYASRRDQELRQQAHQHQIDGADDGDAGENVIDVIGGALARTDSPG